MSRRPGLWDHKGTRRAKARAGRRPRLEVLEPRQLLATFTVDSTADDDVVGTLRWAINQANATAGDDLIEFAIAGAGPHTITPLSALPTIVDRVVIDGNSQGVSSTPLIEIDGSLAGAGVNGLTFSSLGVASASVSRVTGLAINNFAGGAGIRIESGAVNLALEGNFLGTDPSGTLARPNQHGLFIAGSSGNTVGGLTPGTRNVISGNSAAGVLMQGATASNNVLFGNLIGLAVGGNTALGNQGPGVLLQGDGTASSGARNNSIGGTIEAARNIISGNAGPGIRVIDAGATGNLIRRNSIGTNSSGTAAVANNIGIEMGPGAGANTVGGTSLEARNVISGNLDADIQIERSNTNSILGNLIGTTADGTAALPGAVGNVGVRIQNESTGNLIGGSTASAGNVISGHAVAGITILGSNNPSFAAARANIVQGNTIGAAAGGLLAVPNAVGIVLRDGTTENTIGGVTTGARNIISGNTLEGMVLTGDDTERNVVQGNLIGVSSDGTTALANGQDGVRIESGADNTVGGLTTSAGNTIAFNGGTGIAVQSGQGHVLSHNLIFQNGDLGIKLEPGANGDQAAPVLTSATTSGGVTTVAGTLTSTPSSTFTIEFYSDDPPDPSGAGEGRRFLGQTTVTTAADGTGSFNVPLATAATANHAVSAIAIAPNGNTSQFAVNVTNIEVQADLNVTMTAEANPVAPSGVVPTSTFYTYTITVANMGAGAALNVSLANTLPLNTTFIGGTSTQGGPLTQSGSVITVPLGTLAPGASAIVTITIVSPTTVPVAPSTITNSATATTTSSESSTANNTASLTTTVVQGVDLEVTKVATPNPAVVESDLAFIITVTNNTPVAATNVVLTDTLPVGVTFVSATSTQGSVSESGGVVTASLGTIPAAGSAAGSSAQVTIIVKPTATGSITNTATAVADQPQTVANDNTATLTLSVNPSTPVPVGTAPVVTRVQRTGVHGQSTRILVTYSLDMDPLNTRRFANYVLTSAGPDNVFGTADDCRIRVRAIRYDSPTKTIVLTTLNPFSLHLRVRLRVVGQPPRGVRGADGLFLAGRDGEQGTDFVTVFEGRQPVEVAAARPRAAAAGARRLLSRARS